MRDQPHAQTSHRRNRTSYFLCALFHQYYLLCLHTSREVGREVGTTYLSFMAPPSLSISHKQSAQIHKTTHLRCEVGNVPFMRTQWMTAWWKAHGLYTTEIHVCLLEISLRDRNSIGTVHTEKWNLLRIFATIDTVNFERSNASILSSDDVYVWLPRRYSGPVGVWWQRVRGMTSQNSTHLEYQIYVLFSVKHLDIVLHQESHKTKDTIVTIFTGTIS